MNPDKLDDLGLLNLLGDYSQPPRVPLNNDLDFWLTADFPTFNDDERAPTKDFKSDLSFTFKQSELTKSMSITSIYPNPTITNPIKTQEELEKRKKNTEASARFRKKKKILDEAASLTNREMQLQIQMLQQQVSDKDKEIQWLRNMLQFDSRKINSDSMAEKVLFVVT